MVHNSDSDCQQLVAFFSDAMSVLEALSGDKETELYNALKEVCQTRRVTVQWVLAHCSIPGNEEAGELAKAGTQSEQPTTVLSFKEKKDHYQNHAEAQSGERQLPCPQQT